MKYRTQAKLFNELFNTNYIDEDYIIRKMIHDMIDEIPIDELKKSFNVECTYGNIKSLDQAYKDGDKEKYDLIRQLIEQESRIYSIEIDL